MVTAACHVHSDWSYDGKWPLARLAAEFGRRGYRVLLMTEHDRGFTPDRLARYRESCARASSDKVLFIPGIEYSDASNTIHILVWGPVPFLGENLPTASLLESVHSANGLAVMAHPARRDAWQQFDAAWSESLLGIEVWNRKTDGWSPSKAALSLMQGTELLATVGMDFHDRKQMFPLTMELDVLSAIDENSVLECLRARRCRALAFGRPVPNVTSGWLGSALRSAENCRRTAAVVYRAWGKLRVA